LVRAELASKPTVRVRTQTMRPDGEGRTGI
jgi:hypothetical protein